MKPWEWLKVAEFWLNNALAYGYAKSVVEPILAARHQAAAKNKQVVDADK